MVIIDRADESHHIRMIDRLNNPLFVFPGFALDILPPKLTDELVTL
jgi:hypothetical protein